jgi:hypothetical protein
MDNATKIQIIAAQYAGGSSDAIMYDFLGPGLIGVFYCICIVIIIFVLYNIVDGIIEYFSEKNNK